MSAPSIPAPIRRALRWPDIKTQFVARARSIAFWVAVLLPFGYLPLVAVEQIRVSPVVFLCLLAVHIIALIAGHEYRA